MVRVLTKILMAFSLSVELTLSSATVWATTIDSLVISEVFYDRLGGDNGFEWIEIFNGSPLAIDLSGFSFGFAAKNYASATMGLSGIIGAGEYFVLGGPLSDWTNASPNYQVVMDFSPDLQNVGYVSDGIALFEFQSRRIGPTSVPIDAVIYGGVNLNRLINAEGQVFSPIVGDAPSEASIERVSAKGWTIASQPNPGEVPLVPTTLPLPGTLMLFAVGLCFLLRVCSK